MFRILSFVTSATFVNELWNILFLFFVQKHEYCSPDVIHCLDHSTFASIEFLGIRVAEYNGTFENRSSYLSMC